MSWVDRSTGYERVGARAAYIHRLLAETALGRPLPPGVEVHHADGDPANNSRGNLVLCEDRAYHKLLHQRRRALDASGDPEWRKCRFCKQYDAPENLYIHPRFVGHRECAREYDRRRA